MQPPHENHVILLGSSARAATASALAAGWSVTAVDAFGDADLREMCRSYRPLSATFPLAFLRSHQPSTLVPLGGCERWVDALASLRNRHRIAGPTTEQWRLVNEPAVLSQIARAGAVRVPEAHSFDEIDGGIIPATAPRRWLIKTPFSCGGLGVRWAESGPIAPGQLLQRWIPGMSIGASYLATGEEVHLMGVCRGLKYHTESHPAVYAGSCGPLPLAPQWRTKLVRLGHAAAGRLNLRGLFNADLIFHPVDGLYLLEINPRYTSAMELLEPMRWLGQAAEAAAPRRNERACSHRLREPTLMSAHLQCFPEVRAPALPSLAAVSGTEASVRRVRCKRVIFARRNIAFDAKTCRGMRAILDAYGARWADIPVEGATIISGHPVFSIFTEAQSAASALRQAGRIHRAIQRFWR